MLKNQTEFVPVDPEEIQQKTQARKLRRLKQMAEKLGAEIIVPDSQPAIA